MIFFSLIKNKILLYLILVLSIFFLMLIIPLLYPDEPMELGVYGAYTKSIINDFDFNLINDLPSRMTWISSSTLNYPDNRSVFNSLFILPFYIYAKVITFFSIKNYSYAGYDLFDLSYVIAILFYISYTFLILKRLVLSSHKHFTTVVLLLIFSGIGIPFYVLFQPINNDIFVLFLSTVTVSYSLYCYKNPRITLNWYLIGFITMLSFIIKPSTISLLCLSLLLLFNTSNIKKKMGLFVLGGTSILTLYIINSFLKFGFFGTPRLYFLLKFHPTPSGLVSNNLIDSLLYSPLVLVSILFALFIVLFYKKIKANYFVFAISTSLLIKTIVISQSFINNSYFGPRYFLSDLPLIVFIIFYIFNLSSNNKKTSFLILSMIVVSSIIPFLFVLGKIYSGQYPVMLPYLYDLKKYAGTILNNLWRVKKAIIETNVLSLVPLILLSVFSLNYLQRFKEVFVLRLAVTICLVTTVLNYNFNYMNAQKYLSNNVFNNKIISVGPLSFVYDDFLSEIPYLSNSNSVNKQAVNLLSRYLNEIHKETWIDGAGKMKDKIDNPLSFWDDNKFLETQQFRFKRKKQ